MRKYINLFAFILTTFFFIVYWTQVVNWYYEGVNWYGIIGAGFAANGGFIGNTLHYIIEKNAEYQSDHGGKDMPWIANIKSIFKRK